MVLNAHTTKIALVALTLVLAACGRPDEKLVESSAAAAAASTSAFPTGNGKDLTLADCEKLADPKPADDSAASRAAAVGQGQASRAACKKEILEARDKPNEDLARIRQIKEKEQAALAESKISEQEWGKRLNEGANKPIKEYKY